MAYHEPSAHRLPLTLLMLSALWLGGCDMLGIETPGKLAEKKEAEGRAIGSACRHAVRSIEDCYAANPKASKAAIFTGWREMDEYMRENEIQGMPARPEPLPLSAGQAPGEEVMPAPGTQSAAATPGTVALPPKPTVAPPAAPKR